MYRKMIGWLPLILGVFLAGLLLPASAAALKIVVPADGAILASPRHLIVKAGDRADIDGLAVSINGVDSDIIAISSPEYRKTFRDLLILQADFDPGENRIVVKGYAGSKVVAEVRAQVYLQSEFETPPARYRPQPFHVAEREVLCQGCHHNLNPTAKELLSPNPAKHPCASCHAGIIDQKHVHGPAGAFECGSCHNPDSKPARYAVADPDGRFCLECHQDKYDEFRAAKFMHGPVQIGACLLCHDPHASDTLAQVRGPVNASCLRCHEKVKPGDHVVRGISGRGHPLEGPVNPEDQTRPFHCSSCHDPHSGQGKQYLRGGFAASNMSFCQKCHKK